MEADVDKIISNYLKIPGKMIRPKMTEFFGKNFGIPQKDIDTISRAAEMIHNASLIHDDVIDKALTRRGNKTLNQILSNSQAVLAGDFLLAKVIGEVVDSGHYSILKTLARSLEEIVEGEFLQDKMKETGTSEHEQLALVASKKTGSLIGWSCSAPAQVAGQPDEVVAKCRLIGQQLGVAFQMIDDCLDYSTNTGKDYAKDLKDGLINYATLELITMYPELYYTVHQIRNKEFDDSPWTDKQIQNAVLSVQKKAKCLVEETKELVRSLDGKKTKDIENFIDLLQERIR